MKLVLVLCAVAFSSALPSSIDDISSSFLQTGASEAYGSLNLTALTINSGASRQAEIVLGEGQNAFSLSLGADGSFSIKHRGKASFTVGPEGDVLVNGMLKSTGVVRVDGPLKFMGVSQWLLAIHESFSQTATGWSNATTSTCGSPSKRLLGGYGLTAGGEVKKTFRQLPDHTEIRVKANFHFIDAWTGETAFAKLDNQVVWTELHDHMASKNGINICGSPTAESKFAVPIDVVIPHRSSSLTLGFGSSLVVSPLEASWGVSDIQIYVRS